MLPTLHGLHALLEGFPGPTSQPLWEAGGGTTLVFFGSFQHLLGTRDLLSAGWMP